MVILIASTFSGIEFKATDNKDSSPNTKAVF